MRSLPDIFLVSIVTLAILAFLFLIADFVTSESFQILGTVEDKSFAPAESRVQIGVIGNGKIGALTIHKPECYTIVVRADGELRVINVPRVAYFTINRGDVVSLKCRRGRFTKAIQCELDY